MIGLKFRRVATHKTQTRLSCDTGLRQTLISAIERGRVNPTPAELDLLARALDVRDPSLLLREMPDPFADATPEPAA